MPASIQASGGGRTEGNPRTSFLKSPEGSPFPIRSQIPPTPRRPGSSQQVKAAQAGAPDETPAQEQRESLELREVFEDVAVYFIWKAWELLEDEVKVLFQDQMLRNYQASVSLEKKKFHCEPSVMDLFQHHESLL
ncbi:hypothetical protein Y1Q_0022522 [Alligator mississippiensis]|uniref:KRAB domain-containing protein n=1 Tax=Alligator mississippiensis TaxID=8496 RepID=A0A151NZB3_ALLMI|nr:hypothetical protein Y1Q_0022522 [Alligator mississippiensis]